MCLALKLVAGQMMTVDLKRSVITCQGIDKEKNVNHYVSIIHVQGEQLVLHPTIKKFVNATHLCRVMVTHPVMRVYALDFQPTEVHKKLFLFLLAVVAEKPECYTDIDCPSLLACIGKTCQNPCAVNNPCRSGQQCVVIDSQLTRSVACVCPDGFSVGSNGECVRGKKSRYKDDTN